MKRSVIAGVLIGAMVLSQSAFAASAPLAGTVNTPKWAGSEALLVKVDTADGSEYRKLKLNGESEVLVKVSANATEATVSKDGSKVAYVNDNGDLFVVDAATKVEQKVSVDNDPKMELQFNATGTKLYYLSGDKIDKVAVVNLADGKQTMIVSDGVPYKSELEISSDEATAVYLVTNAGKIDEANDAFTVDSTGTEPQIYIAKLGSTEKPMKLTSEATNKVYSTLLDNGQIAYVNAKDTSDDLPLKLLSTDGKSDKYFVSHLKVEGIQKLEDGSLLVVGENDLYKKSLFVVDEKGATKRLAILPEATTDVVAKDLNHIVITQSTQDGEKASLLKDGKFVDLTK